MALTWEGQKVTKKLEAAQVAGVNRTMADCVVHAKRSHAWRNRTGTLEGSIDVVEYAHATPTGVRGVWGSVDVVYALIHELGGTITPKKAKALVFPGEDGRLVAVQSVTIPARPYLRPAADAIYPSLSKNVREAFERAAKAAIALVFATALWLTISPPAAAHGDAEWIRQSRFGWCCGPRDCHEVAAESVRIEGGAALIPYGGRVHRVPLAQLKPSINRNYWVCLDAAGRMRAREDDGTCAFGPFGGM